MRARQPSGGVASGSAPPAKQAWPPLAASRSRMASPTSRRTHLTQAVATSQLFAAMDVNRDDHISLHEFKTGLNMVGIHPEKSELGILFECFDLDNDGPRAPQYSPQMRMCRRLREHNTQRLEAARCRGAVVTSRVPHPPPRAGRITWNEITAVLAQEYDHGFGAAAAPKSGPAQQHARSSRGSTPQRRASSRPSTTSSLPRGGPRPRPPPVLRSEDIRPSTVSRSVSHSSTAVAAAAATHDYWQRPGTALSGQGGAKADAAPRSKAGVVPR